MQDIRKNGINNEYQHFTLYIFAWKLRKSMMLEQIDSSIKITILDKGYDALEMIKSPAFVLPDIPLLDMNMPKMDRVTFISE